MATLQEGMRLFRLKRWELALREFTSINPNDLDKEQASELSYYLGLCYTRVERFEEALNYLEQVVTNDKNPLRVQQCRVTLAFVYASTKRAEMAEAELNKLTRTGFTSAILYNILGYALFAQNKVQKAIEFYKMALALDNNSTSALNGLGFALVESGTDIVRGLQLCQKAASMKPRNPTYLDSLGWAYYKNGNAIEAKNCLRQALELAPQQREIRRHSKIVAGNGEFN
ncbi:MAG: tetratricopeptide repeat protein [Treponema sp.]|jgi:tetratricopeptide (TPR) repeat protein|nr:tetratricopeptide repeat protein [Treponema sp.]